MLHGSTCTCGHICGNACVRGTRRTAAIVKMILSRRQTMTTGELTVYFANYRVDKDHHKETTPDTLCQFIYPNPPSVLMACIHIFSRLQKFGMHSEKNSIHTGITCSATLTSVQPNETEQTTWIYSGLDSRTFVWCATLTKKSLVKPLASNRPLYLAICLRNVLVGDFNFTRKLCTNICSLQTADLCLCLLIWVAL